MNDATDSCEIAILVAPKYSQLTLAAITEPLRLANTVAGRQLYNWRLLSDGGKPVTSSSGLTLAVQHDTAELGTCDALFIVASYEARSFATSRVISFLWRMSGRVSLMAGLDAAPYVLAEAGLLNGYLATTHWDDLTDFQERYPSVDVVSQRYVVDRNRATTSGSLPSFDFVLDFIRRRDGLALAMNVSGNFLYDQATPGTEQQFMISTASIGVRQPKLAQVIRIMEQTLQSPLTVAQLAARVGLSERSLLRRFRASLNTTPQQYYRNLRLDTGRRLLDNSDLSVTDVAIACGFESRNSFTRAYRQAFGTPPSAQRKGGAP